jgi:dTMP kinase
VRSVHEPFTRPPDATLYLDVPPEVGAERAGATNKFETAAYLREVRSNYERLIDADPDRFHRIDATRSEDAVAERAREIVAGLLG